MEVVKSEADRWLIAKQWSRTSILNLWAQCELNGSERFRHRAVSFARLGKNDERGSFESARVNPELNALVEKINNALS